MWYLLLNVKSLYIFDFEKIILWKQLKTISLEIDGKKSLISILTIIFLFLWNSALSLIDLLDINHVILFGNVIKYGVKILVKIDFCISY